MLETKEGLMFRSVGENIDSVVTVDLRGYGVPRIIYKTAREICGQPLSTFTAKSLADNVQTNDIVLIGTGFVFPPWFKGELDGVVGSIVLARALEKAFGAKPLILCEEEVVHPAQKLLTTAGLNVYNEVDELRRHPRSAMVMEISRDLAIAQKQGDCLLKETHAKIMLSVERPGRNTEGVYHMGNGIPVSGAAAKIDVIFEMMQQNGGLTIGVGDLGNELGMGAIADTIRKYIPYGAECKCRCKSGIAAAVSADICVVAAVSDWACYGLAAALSYVTGNPDVLHSPDLERRLLRAASESGLIDGSGYAIPSVDGIDEEYNVMLVRMLGQIVNSGFTGIKNYSHMYEEILQLRERV